jgi:hypothetical protein
MGYATFGQMLQWIEAPLAKKVSDNRCEMVEYANRIRQHFYLLYETTPLYMDGEECFCVEEFPLDCNCKETFLGITLPAEYQTVEAIWKNDTPIKMYDKWREYRDGIRSSCNCPCRYEMVDIENFFPTERELSPCGTNKFVKFMANNSKDCGKKLTVRYIDANGKSLSEQSLLPTKTIASFLSIHPLNQFHLTGE